jgi:hypothetical protein
VDARARSLIFVSACVLVLPACSEDAAEQAVDKAKDQAKDKAGELWAERPATGELSEAAKGIFNKGAEASDGSVEALLAKGVQLAPVAVDIAKTLHSAIDSEIDVEPIVQKLDDYTSQADLDARIADLPRVEAINGLDVGFKDVSQWDTRGRETQSAYLVLWRRDDQLLGLVYRSKKRINVDQLIAEAPRLIGLVTGAL